VLAQKADLIKLNEDELTVLTGMEVTGDTPEGALQQLATLTGLSRICLSCGSSGALFWDKGEITRADAPQVEVVDTVGAGDAFTAAVTLGLCRGESPDLFLPRACRLGAFVASRAGAVPDYNIKGTSIVSY